MDTVAPVIKVEQFEGPYDVLLELIAQEKLDISTLSLTAITDNFLQYVKTGNIAPELQADFLVVASTMLLLKIKRALPTLEVEEEEEINALTDRVKIYQLYREAGLHIREEWRFGALLPAGFWGSGQVRLTLPHFFKGISAEDLANFMVLVVDHIPKPAQPTAHLIVKSRSLKEALGLFEERLGRASTFVFHEAVDSSNSQDIAVSFLAVLELARQQVVHLHQTDHFDSIVVERK